MQAPLSRSISNGSDEYGRPKKSAGRVQPDPSGTLEGSITALADALSSLDAGMPPDKAGQLEFEPLDLVSLYLLKHLRPLPSASFSMLLAGSSAATWQCLSTLSAVHLTRLSYVCLCASFYCTLLDPFPVALTDYTADSCNLHIT